MKGQFRGLAGPLVKLVVFAVVTMLAAYVLVSTITNAGYGEQLTYRAEFSDVAGLVEGDEVRIAGVRVGQITGIGLAERTDRPWAVVEFEVSASNEETFSSSSPGVNGFCRKPIAPASSSPGISSRLYPETSNTGRLGRSRVSLLASSVPPSFAMTTSLITRSIAGL